VTLVADVSSWICRALLWGILVLQVWAAIDCVTRKAAAFPAAGKLTKPAWLALTLFSALLGYLISPSLSGGQGQYGPPGLLTLIFLIVSLVYLADVRPAVREISGGSRW